MKKCIRCGKDIFDKTVNCPYCSAKQAFKEENSEKRFCTKCGAELWKSGKFCYRCGATIKNESNIENGRIEKTDLENIPKNVLIKENGIEQNSNSIFELYCLFVAFIYGCFTFYDIWYITSYYNSVIWGGLIILSGAWNTFVFALIGIRCRKEYGKNLLCSLAIGSVVKIVLHLYNIKQCAKYYLNNSSDIYAIVAIIMSISVCGYMMKKYEFIVFEENDNFFQIFKDIPWALNKAVNGENNKKNKIIIDENLPKGKLQAVILSKEFIIFSTIYTINLAIGIFTDISILKIIFQILPIIFCIGIWIIYGNRYKKTMSSTGFSMVNIVFTIEFCLRIVALALVIIAILAIGLGQIGATLIIWSTIIMLLDIVYWWSLRKTAISIEDIAINNYQYFGMDVSLYVIFVLILQTILKLVGFLWACYLQNMANTINNTLNLYGENVNSIVGYITDVLGLGYRVGYDVSSNKVNSLLSPVTEWIQSVLGFSQSPFVMIVSIAVPISSIVFLLKIRSYKTKVS